VGPQLLKWLGPGDRRNSRTNGHRLPFQTDGIARISHTPAGLPQTRTHNLPRLPTAPRGEYTQFFPGQFAPIPPSFPQSLAPRLPTRPGTRNGGGIANKRDKRTLLGLQDRVSSILQHHRIGHQHRKSPRRAGNIRPEIKVTNKFIS